MQRDPFRNMARLFEARPKDRDWPTQPDATDAWDLPIHSAARQGNCEFVRELLGKGADVNALNWRGETPLALAAIHDATQVGVLLLTLGADPEIADIRGYTPLHWALTGANRELVKALLEHGANPNVPERISGEYPIHMAAAELVDLVQLLVAYGAKLNPVHPEGWLPVHYAAVHGQGDVVKYLVEQHQDISPANSDGKTPLDLAVEEGFTAVAELIRSLGGRSGQDRESASSHPANEAGET